VLAFPLSFGGIEGGLLLLGALQLVGDGGVNRGYLVVGALAGLPLPIELLLQLHQPLQGLAEPRLEFVSALMFAGQIGLETIVFGFGLIQLLAAALNELVREQLGEFLDGEVGVHGRGWLTNDQHLAGDPSRCGRLAYSGRPLRQTAPTGPLHR